MVDAIRTGKRAKAALAVASLVGLGSSVAHAATISSASVNFNNGSTDLTGNFNQESNGVTGTSFSYGPSAGVQDGGTPNQGGVLPVTPHLDDSLIYSGGSLDFSTGNTYTLSLMYQRAATNPLAGTSRVQLGVVDGSNRSFNGGSNDAGYNFISARVTGGATQDAFAGQGAVNAPGQTNGGANFAGNNNGTTFTYAAGHWYQLNVNITETNTSTGVFNITGSVVDFGTAGTAAGATVSLFPSNGTATFTDANLAGTLGQALWAGWRDAGNGTNPDMATAYDNFAVSSTPEPASVALLALGGLAGLARRRRRV